VTRTSLSVAALHLPPVPFNAGPMPEVARPWLDAAAAQGARLIVLPELFAWPFFCACPPADWGHVGEALDGPTLTWAAAQAVRLGVSLMVPLALAVAGDRPRNAVALVRPSGQVELAAQKIHLPPKGAAAFGEPDHFSVGPPEVHCHEIKGLSVAVFVCFDRRFPETWRAAREAGADLVVCPVCGPADEPDDFFDVELRTHARENAMWALTSGRTGAETLPSGEVIRHNAPSALISPDGAVLKSLGARSGPGFITGTISREAIALARSERPHFEMRKTIRGQCAPAKGMEGLRECLN